LSDFDNWPRGFWWGTGSVNTETRFRYIQFIANQKCWILIIQTIHLN
jgi:hypothetical protein